MYRIGYQTARSLPSVYFSRISYDRAHRARSSGDTIPVRREPCQVLVFSGCNSHPATGSLQPVAIGAGVEPIVPPSAAPSRPVNSGLGDLVLIVTCLYSGVW